MVKPEKFGHLHLVYHFTVPLSIHFLAKYHFTKRGKLCKFCFQNPLCCGCYSPVKYILIVVKHLNT